MGYSPWGCKESDTTEPLHFQGEIVAEVLLFVCFSSDGQG